MTGKHEVKHGLPSVKKVVELLNAAYGDWGNEKMFEWKYNYPGTARDEHHLYICQGSKLTAFTRLYHRTLNIGKEQLSVVVRGNAAVHPDNQGQGQYKALHKANDEHCKSEKTDVIATFNRKGNFSFQTSSKTHWSYFELPLYITILSPGVALNQYASPVIRSNKILGRLVSLCGDRVRVEVGGTRTSLSELAGKPERDCKGITVHISSGALHKLVSLAANSAGFGTIARKVLSLLAHNEMSLFLPIHSDRVNFSMGTVAVIPPGAHTADEVEQMVELYHSTVHNSNIVHFRRNADDIDHMLRHPHLMGTLYLERDNELVGFAPLYVVRTGDVREARVSELVCVDSKAEKEIIEAIIVFCQNNNIDIIAMFSGGPLIGQWAHIRRHVLMWDDLRSNGQKTDLQHLRLGFYDVV